MAINGSFLKVHTIVGNAEDIDTETMKFLQNKTIHAMHTTAVNCDGLKIIRTIDYEEVPPK
jgi:flagellar basal body rod protein FlgB